MALDENIYELRREKLKQIEALGQRTYPNRYDYTYNVGQILATFSEKTAEQLDASRVQVRVAGRIMANRLMGKAGFAHLQQDGQSLFELATRLFPARAFGLQGLGSFSGLLLSPGEVAVGR